MKVTENARYIETDLGREKLCIHCNDYYPLDGQFWVSKKVTLKSGIQTVRFYSACKGCYQERYKVKENQAQARYLAKIAKGVKAA